jgi:hypothetical protein
VESFQYVEDSHVPHVFFLHVLKKLHVNRLTSAASEEAGDGAACPERRAGPRRAAIVPGVVSFPS